MGQDLVGEILQFIRPENAFDPETMAILVDAYDRAIAQLHDRGQPDIVREVIARRIIELAGRGKRDAMALCDAALTAIGIPG